MSFRRKILDGVNSVMDKVAADDTPLSHVDEAELQEELERRMAMRKAAPRAPADNPRARLAGASPAARQERDTRARERDKRVGSARTARQSAERAARERAFRDAQARARAQASQRRPPPSSSSRRSSTRGSARARSPFARKDDKIARYYKILDLPYGADFDQVKAAYRKLIRKYHPDLHGGTPQKQKAATELTMRVTQAYNELEQHLLGGPNKR
jgi:hypothetical protein